MRSISPWTAAASAAIHLSSTTSVLTSASVSVGYLAYGFGVQVGLRLLERLLAARLPGSHSASQALSTAASAFVSSSVSIRGLISFSRAVNVARVTLPSCPHPLRPGLRERAFLAAVLFLQLGHLRGELSSSASVSSTAACSAAK